MGGGGNGVVMDMNEKVEKALAQKITWLDQQGIPATIVDRIAQDIREMGAMKRASMQYHILAMAVMLGIRAEHEAAALLLDAYRRMERTPPPKKGGQQ